MKMCSVPRCTSTKQLHAVPFTDKLRWKQWTTVCPYFLKYNLRQLENVKICNKHFAPQHINNENGRLTKDAKPLFHLKPSKHKKKKDVLEGNKLLEVSPLLPNESVNVKVVPPTASLLAQMANNNHNNIMHSSTEGKTEKCQVRHLVHLKAEDSHGLPVDHNMYCLPFPEDERHACLFSPCVMCQTPSKELMSSDCTNLSFEGQQRGATVDSHMYCKTPEPGASAACLPAELDQQAAKPPNVEFNIKIKPVTKEALGIVDTQLRSLIIEQGMSDAASTGRMSVASQAEDAQEVSDQHWEQLPHTLSTDIEQSLKVEQDTEAVELLLDCQGGRINNNVQDNVQVLQTRTVAEDGAQTGQAQSVYLSPNIFNLLTRKSPLEKDTLESIHSLFKALKEQHNLQFNHVPIEPSERFNLNKKLVKLNSSELNNGHSVMKPIANVAQPFQSRSAQKQTLASLVAELTESVSAEEMAEAQSASAVMAAETPSATSDATPFRFTCMQDAPLSPLHHSLPSNTEIPSATSDATPFRFTCMQDAPLSPLHHSLPSNTEIRRVRLDKENSTPNERLLRLQVNKLKKINRNLTLRYKKLKSKSDTILAKAKEFIKSYPHLSQEGKLLVDLQIRLARQRSKGARYSEEEKLFAFKLLKITPEGYKYLQPLLKLPARSTMKEFEKCV